MKKIFLLLIMLGLYVNTTYSQEDTTNDKIEVKDAAIEIDENTAVSLAFANNLDLKSEKQKFASSVWVMATSWNTFIPDITMSASLSKSNLNTTNRTQTVTGLIPVNPIDNGYYRYYDGVIPYSKDVKAHGTSLAANFDLSFNLNAAMGFQVLQTILDYRSGKIGLEKAKKSLETTVRSNLYYLIVLQEDIKITEGSLKNAERRYRQALINYQNGLKSEYDMLSSQVFFENLKPVLLAKKNAYNAFILDFKQTIGIKKDYEIKVTGKIETTDKKSFNANELINKYLNSNLDVKNFKNSLQLARNARNTQIASLTPTFSIRYSMDPVYQEDPTDKDHQWVKNDLDYMEEHWKQTRGAFTIVGSLPISSWVLFSKEQVNALKSQFLMNETRYQLQKAKEQVEKQIVTIVMNLEKSKQSIESLKLNVKLAERAYEKAEEAYKYGRMDLLEVQNSENDLNNAKYNLLNEEYNYTKNLLDLKYITNSNLQ